MAKVNRVKSLFISSIIIFFTLIGSSKALEIIRDTELENFTNDIIKILGAPSTKSILEDDLWIYIENRKSKSSLLKLGKSVVVASNVLVLEINNKGLLKNKRFYNLNDQNKINFTKDETMMSEKDSFVFGVISSLRQKIDSPKRNSK